MDGNDDDDLQAALALSMQNQQSTSNNNNNSNNTPTSMKRSNMDTSPNNSVSNSTNNNSSSTEFNCKTFHKLMWNDNTTTTNDKERWLYECISTPSLSNNNITSEESSGGSGPSNSVAAMSTEKSMVESSKEQQESDLTTPLQIFTNSTISTKSTTTTTASTNSTTNNNTPKQQPIWGLTQKHGGPCGVLASIQAEVIRILLFGRGAGGYDSDMGGGGELYYPFVPKSTENYLNCVSAPICDYEVREALGMAIGMILARASLASTLNNGSSSVMGGDDERRDTVRLVLPIDDSGRARSQSVVARTEEEAKSGGESASSSSTIQEAGWIQEMLSNSTTSTGDCSADRSSGLKVHIISSLDESNRDTNNNMDGPPNMKRARSPTTEVLSDLSSEQKKLVTLAKSVSNFLLSEEEEVEVAKEEDDGDEKMEAAASMDTNTIATNTNGAASKVSCPLDNFTSPGGVMYLVMSLVESRGIDRIRNDFDDPNTTITAQFGHSSQELMNLLLTGQATSNVFDNSMSVSEDLQCHGIQNRPAIGYLSILESLRYCEVGGYYKSPLFPIWVVGSTSHFTVLFGDEECLKESKSDILLEKCRRAFQKVEGGGGESAGFIPVEKLGDVVDELDLRTQVGGDHGIATLKAYLETSGTGIILWNDFWKAASRLMTGSSIEALMSSQDKVDVMNIDDDDDVPLLITQHGEVTVDGMTTPPPIAAGGGGTWSCSSCTFINRGADQKCSICNAARGTDQGAAADDGTAKTNGDTAATSTSSWSCEACTFKNEDGNATSCSICGTARAGTNQAVTFSPIGSGDIDDLASQMATADPNSPREAAAALCSLSDRPSTPFRASEGTDNDEDVKMGAAEKGAASTTEGTQPKTTQQLEFEQHGLSFPLYHYNGLYGGKLTPFRLTRLSAEEAVGASIALSRSGGGSGGDFEDVLRTKWPSSLINWLGGQSPSID